MTLCAASREQLAKLSNDETSGEILRLYEAHRQLHKASGLNGLTESQKLAYRRSVEGLTGGTDTKLFRIEWVCHRLFFFFWCDIRAFDLTERWVVLAFVCSGDADTATWE